MHIYVYIYIYIYIAPKGAFLVTEDVAGLYHSIPHSEGLDITMSMKSIPIKKYQEKIENSKIADFVLKNNLFEFDSKFYKQLSGTVWTESEESIEKILEDLNKFHPNLKFTYENSKEKTNFLDVTIKIQEGRIITNLYCKPTDGNQYLQYDSCHVDHSRSYLTKQSD